jgi:type I restriction enzyme S subunit
MNAEMLLAHYDRIADAPDAVARLRRFVLDLAVRGKLVPQDAGDEPAAVLLEKSAKEKARLAKAGFRKAGRLAPDVLDYPFELPTSWQWSQLAEVGIISPRNDADDDLEVSFVPMALIAAEYGVSNGHELRKWSEIKKGYTHFAEKDVGLAKITPCFENGKSTVFRGLKNKIGAGTTELHIVRPLFIESDYVLIFLKSPFFIENGIPNMTGTAGQKRVPADYFAGCPFPLPPLAEQRRVVAKVDELMALCDQLEAARAVREETRDRMAAASLARLNNPDPETFPTDAHFALNALPALTTRPDQVKQLRQTILNLAVRGMLVPQSPADESVDTTLHLIDGQTGRKAILSGADEDWPYEVHNSWRWITLGRLVLHSDAGWSPKTADQPRSEDEWGVLKVSAVSWGSFRPDENKALLPGMQPKRQAVVAKGDFLISRANTSELVARAVIVGIEPHNLMMSDKIVRLKIADYCDKNYICIVNNYADFARYYYATQATGVSPSMKNVSRDVILNLPIPLPPLAEQRRIVAKVNELTALCDGLEAALSSASATRARLLEATLQAALAPAAALANAAE